MPAQAQQAAPKLEKLSTDDLIALHKVESISTDDLIKQHQEEIKPARIKATKGEALVRGAAQGVSLGLADEGAGLYNYVKKSMSRGAPSPDFIESYREGRDEYRLKDAAAAKDEPGAYIGGNIAGGVATAFVPGLGWMNAAKGASLGQKLMTAGKAGALIGFGTSNADLTKGEVQGVAGDTLTGAGVGVAAQGAMSAGGALLKAIKPQNAAKKLANVFLNTPEEITDTYIKEGVKAAETGGKNAVIEAPLRYELAKDLEEKGVKGLKSLVIEGSKESKEILAKEATTFKAGDLAQILESKADDIVQKAEGILDDPGEQAAYNWLKSTAEKFNKAPDQELSAGRLKKFVQSIDRAKQWNIGAGNFADVDDVIRGDVRKIVDTMVKEKSPAYREQMVQVAKDARLLDDVNAVAKSPKGWANVVRRVETDQYGPGQLPREVLEKLDARLGTDFLHQAMLSNTREAFDKSITNGSMNVNKFANMLKDVPIVRYIAPLVGASVDKYGRKMTMGAVDAAIKAETILNKSGFKAFAEALQPLKNAAQKGNPAAVLTFQFLNESNPNAIKTLNQQDAMDRRRAQ